MITTIIKIETHVYVYKLLSYVESNLDIKPLTFYENVFAELRFD